MIVISARNVNEALLIGTGAILAHAERKPSRAGDVLEVPVPVTTHYRNPKERVIFSPARDANPFFHLFEALHMLAGRRDVAFLEHYNKRMLEYSDDGKTLNGSAYGYRWRHHFGYDQLELAIAELTDNPRSRRVVIQHWDARGGRDFLSDNANRESKDLPCNTAIYLDIRNGKLNITVTNRSNDMLWGAYGANVVHFSLLQEYLAAKIGVPVGGYWQVSNNFHVYADNPVWLRVQQDYEVNRLGYDRYEIGEVNYVPFVSDIKTIDQDIETVVAYDSPHESRLYHNIFFTLVVQPMLCAWECWKIKDIKSALAHTDAIIASDWRKACREWLLRREEKKNVG